MTNWQGRRWIEEEGRLANGSRIKGAAKSVEKIKNANKKICSEFNTF